MIKYDQQSGETYIDDEFEGIGYSGTGVGRNNPDEEGTENVGPIPRGRYIVGPAHDHPKLGPIVFNLDPFEHDALGRSAFRIHGDNISHDASHGCIILGRSLREKIRDTNQQKLMVL